MASSDLQTTAQLQLTQIGGPFETVQVPKPTLAPGEVLIRQKVIAFNLVDVKRRDTGIMISSWPQVIGIEGAGIIEKIGSEVHGLEVGDEVGAWESAAFAEHVVVPEYRVMKKPKNISLEEAASLPVCYITAVCAIVKILGIPLSFLKGTLTNGNLPSSILILGGSSGTGAAVIQLLKKEYPALPILATSSPKHHAHLRRLGATSLFDYKSASVVNDIKAGSPGANGVDVIIDCVSAGAIQSDICDVLDPTGSKRYAAVVTAIPIPVPEGVEKLDVMGWDILGMEGGKQLIPSLTQLIEDGVYLVPIPVRVVGHGLEQLPHVLDEVKKVSGEKVVLTL